MRRLINHPFHLLLVLVFAVTALETSSRASASAMNLVQVEPQAPSGGGPAIEVWYGSSQSFGSIGQTQQQVNILGRVSDPEGVSSFMYSLNGGPQVDQRLGPDTRRLLKLGDFNVELFDGVLRNGANTLVLTAVDGLNNTSTATITVNYRRDKVWPLPYTLNWTSSKSLNDQVRVVDGRWSVANGGVRTVSTDLGYDRLIGIGDISWRDYEVTVPVTIHDIDMAGFAFPSNQPGVGVLLRWAGHTDLPIATTNPKSGWYPYGMLAWYAYRQQEPLSGRLELYDNENNVHVFDGTGFTLGTDVTYIFKARVETGSDSIPTYAFKVWNQGDLEPAGWQLMGVGVAGDPVSGSFLLLAHHVDVTFGNVTVTPLGDPPEASKLVSDDFNRCAMNKSLWTVIDPVGDATLTLENPFTSSAGLLISLPDGAEHDISIEDTRVPRIMQAANDTDFEVETKFHSGMSEQYQIQGIMVEQDMNNILRFEFFSDGASTRMYSATYRNGVHAIQRNDSVATNGVTPLYMRLSRVGQRWIGWYSLNGSAWTAFASFASTLKTNQVGLYAGNGGEFDSPGHTMEVDYFFNTASPIVSEDGGSNNLSIGVSPAGKGTVIVQPQKSNYRCGENVTLTARPASDWSFSHWSGALSGSSNPALIAMEGPSTVTANFKEGSTPYEVFIPMIAK